MARRKKVLKFADQTVLLGNINTQVIADGPTGPMVGVLASKAINLADDVATGVTASKNDVLFLADQKQSQLLMQQRNLLMDPINKDAADCLQFLKSLFKPNFKLVGNWGATITDGGKITYPTSTAEQVTLIDAIKTQNESYVLPAISPLAPFLTLQKINLANDSTDGATALLRESASLTAKRSAENYRELRDKNWPTVLTHIDEIGDFAMKFFKGNTKALGAYGFVVVDSAPVDKERSIVLAVGGKKLKIVVKIGSTILISGTVGVNIYKGKTISGTPTLAAAGSIFLILKGNSTISVENTSATVKAKITLVPA